MATTVLKKPSVKAAPYWGMLQGLSKPLKLELVMLLSESMEEKDASPTLPPSSSNEDERKDGQMRLTGSWADMDDKMLDAALAKFHKDWGGEGSALEIAEELRNGRENTRTVETW